jgi:hypothetical protein
VFGHELTNLARHARRDRHFAEIYHPLTGEVYGGMQEASGRGIILWEATSRQTWAATAYVRMILLGLVGMRFDTDGVRLEPCVPSGVTFVEIRNLRYRKMNLSVTIQGSGTNVKECTINGQPAGESPLLGASETGPRHAVIVLKPG